MNTTNSNSTSRKRALRNVAVAGTATATWVITFGATSGLLPLLAREPANHNETLLRADLPCNGSGSVARPS